MLWPDALFWLFVSTALGVLGVPLAMWIERRWP
jgi:hypothetical protein